MNKAIYIFLFSILFYLGNAQTSLAVWNFDDQNTTVDIGTGTLTFVGGTTSESYINNGGTQALGFAGFPLDGTASGTAGIAFATNTTNHTGISLTFDTWGHNQSSRWQQYEYSIDGTNWLILGNNAGGLTANPQTITQTLPASCDNNPNFKFRIVSIFSQPANTNYQQVTGGGYNGNNGKWYFDNVKINYTNTLGIAQNSISGLNVFPIPAKHEVNITSDLNAKKYILIYDLTGKKVFETTTIDKSILLPSLGKGVYSLLVNEEGKTHNQKLIID